MNVEVALAIPLIFLLLLVILRRESDIDVAVKRTKILDARLIREFNANGDTFEERINDLKKKKKLPDEVINTLHDIRLKRNDVVHVMGHDTLPSRRKFIQACDYVEVELDRLSPRKPARNNAWGCLFVSSMLAAFAYVLSQTLD